MTIIDFFSEPICEDFGQANIFCEQSKLQWAATDYKCMYVCVYAATYIGYQLCPANAMINTIGAYMAYFHRLVHQLNCMHYTMHSDISMDTF